MAEHDSSRPGNGASAAFGSPGKSPDPPPLPGESKPEQKLRTAVPLPPTADARLLDAADSQVCDSPLPPPVPRDLLASEAVAAPPIVLPQTTGLDSDPLFPDQPVPPPVAVELSETAPVPAPPIAPPETASLLPPHSPEQEQDVVVPAMDDELEDDADGLTRTVKAAPPWLVSCVVHMMIILVLGLLTYQATLRQPQIVLEASYTDQVGEQLDLETLSDAELLEPDDLNIVAEDLDPIEEPLIAPPPEIISPDGFLPTDDIAAPRMGMLLSGREPGMKGALLAAYGGSEATEAAVLEGLRWLERRQDSDGLWSLSGRYHQSAESRSATYADGAEAENKSAATGMALLAFGGYGQTHEAGPHKDFRRAVHKAIKGLLKRQDADGSFMRGISSHERSMRGHHIMYTHAICTFALCELYAMSGDEELRAPAQRAINYLVERQQPQGGWRYTVGSDLSVTGWVMMALQSARMADLDVPNDTLYRIDRFMDRVAVQGGRRYSYQPNGRWTLAMTAEGMLCRQYLGWQVDNELMASGEKLFLENPIEASNQDVYYWYYATQVLHNMEGESWKEWNKHLSTRLPAMQERNEREDGSWSPLKDAWGKFGGRLYTTCLSIYMLEVYYRHLPIYSQNFGIQIGAAEPTDP